MEIEVRRTTADDWAVYRDVRLRALADAPDAFQATHSEALTIPEEVWRERSGGPSPTFLAYEDSRAVAMGGAFVPPGQEDAMVWGMWTAPEARGRGHGARILGEILAWADALHRDLVLHVTEGNDAARRLYTAHGFAPTGQWWPLRDDTHLRVETLRRPGLRD